MREIPITEILKWPTPNYVNPETRGNTLLVVDTVFLVLTLVAVSLRVYTRVHIQKWFGIDDIFALLALVSTVAIISSRSLHPLL
jgi:hypothetical protein